MRYLIWNIVYLSLGVVMMVDGIISIFSGEEYLIQFLFFWVMILLMDMNEIKRKLHA